MDKDKNTSKIYLKVERCKNSTATSCSTNDEIDDWLDGKEFAMGYINSRVSLQPPYSSSMKQFASGVDIITLSKDTLSRGMYYLK